MNNIDEMWPICHDCPYWEVCEPPYICEATEQKMKAENGLSLNGLIRLPENPIIDREHRA